MRVNIDGHGVTLDDGALVGEGGEARVFALGDDVVKIFFDGAPDTLVALREKKLRAFPAGLPANVLAPLSLATNDAGDVVGYRMHRVRGAVDLGLLARPGARAARDRNGVLALFRALLSTVDALHARGVVVGDLNDGNVLVGDNGAGQPFVIDADSMQFGGLPCPVAHERFLDPHLYGVDLGRSPRFSSSSDHYALRVLLLQSLCLVHPYGGVHPTLPTLLRRAEARHSVFRNDVTLPRAALALSTLPEALSADLRACFDDDKRMPLSPALLDAAAARYVRCGCGVEHARKACPACRVQTTVPVDVVRGGIVVSRVLHAPGAVVAVEVAAGRAHAVVGDGEGRLLREGRVLVNDGADNVVAVLDGARTWLGLCADDDGDVPLVCLASDRAGGDGVVDRTSTARAFGAPAFCVSPAGLFRIAGDAIVHHDSGVIVGRALRGRTWLFAVDDGCLAVWRAGRLLRALWCRRGKAPTDIALPALSGRVVDVAIAAAGTRALVSFATDDSGQRRHRATLLDDSGVVVAHVEGAAESHPLLGNVRGKIVNGDTVLSTSPRGLVAVQAAGGAFVQRAAFADTAHLVDDSVDLLAGSGGDVFVVAHREVHLLRRRAST
jgi:hypothetical protein